MHTAALLPYVPVGAEHLLFFSHTDLKCFPRGWSWTSFPQTLPRKHQKKSLLLNNKTSDNSHSTAKQTQFQMKLENFSTNSRPKFSRVLGSSAVKTLKGNYSYSEIIQNALQPYFTSVEMIGSLLSRNWGEFQQIESLQGYLSSEKNEILPI